MALFTEAEARAFKLGGSTPLSDTAVYLTADITAAATRAKEMFEEYCNVAFESTSTTESHDGDGSQFLKLRNHRVTAVTACTIDGAAASTSDIIVYPTGKLWRLAGWPRGSQRQNIAVTYTHGWAATPSRIKRAALLYAVHELALAGQAAANLSALSVTDEMGMTTRLSLPSWDAGRPTGLRDVDAALNQYRERVPF